MRPRLHPWIPLLRLHDGAVQVGTDPQRRVRLASEAAAAVLAAAAAMDGRLLREDLDQDPLVARGLALLCESGALMDADEHPRGWQALHHRTRQDLTRGALTRAVSTQGRLSSGTVTARTSVEVTVWGPRPLAAAVTTALASAGFNRTVCIDAEAAAIGQTDRVILIGRPKWAVVSGLMRNSIPHVALSPRAASIRIGPFVEPGRSACLRCLHLARGDRDPNWPLISEQLDRLVVPEPDPALVTLATGLFALLFTEWADSAPPRVLNRVVEVSAPLGLRAEREIAVHPACGCTWPEALPDSG
ncbi:MAG: hypothetical protein U0990_01965 [Candidatus Nanopelagicales bacterium]|nr:hypothetical protein [Candidatus Nanopelagicales bacterium]MDZ4248835.1 hypothetical protein [Candidatus Nanopelagicales bacterium]MDZ7578369.1 hypothetical protein [Candidatus Nanopelagicales bacterium]